MNNFDWEKFFKDWKEEYGVEIFVKDGIIDPDKYENLLFILKDANNANGEQDPDLRKTLVVSCSDGKTWFPAAYWTTALLDGNSEFEEIEKERYEKNHIFMHEQMRRIAVINLKKEAGKPAADDKEINDYARKHREKIKEQIEACNPNLIIVCGVNVFEGAKAVLGKVTPINKERPTFEMANNWEIGTVDLNNQSVPIVQFRHPSVGCSAKKSYNDMIKIRKYLFG